DIKADEMTDAALLGSEGGMANAEKRIHDNQVRSSPVDFDTVHCQLDRKCRRMRSFFRTVHNSLVWDEPIIATAAQIAAVGVTPSCYVRFVGVCDSNAQTV